eukprot:CFRG7035T1
MSTSDYKSARDGLVDSVRTSSTQNLNIQDSTNRRCSTVSADVLTRQSRRLSGQSPSPTKTPLNASSKIHSKIQIKTYTSLQSTHNGGAPVSTPTRTHRTRPKISNVMSVNTANKAEELIVTSIPISTSKFLTQPPSSAKITPSEVTSRADYDVCDDVSKSLSTSVSDRDINITTDKVSARSNPTSTTSFTSPYQSTVVKQAVINCDEIEHDSTAVTSIGMLSTKTSTPSVANSVGMDSNSCGTMPENQNNAEKDTMQKKKKKKTKKKNDDTMNDMLLMYGGRPKRKPTKSKTTTIQDSDDDGDKPTKVSKRSRKHEEPLFQSSLMAKKLKVYMDISSDDELEEGNLSKIEILKKKEEEKRRQRELQRRESILALSGSPPPVLTSIPSNKINVADQTVVFAVNHQANRTSQLIREIEQLKHADEDCMQTASLVLKLRNADNEIINFKTGVVDTFESMYEWLNDMHSSKDKVVVVWRDGYADDFPITSIFKTGAGNKVIYRSDTPRKLKLTSDTILEFRLQDREIADKILGSKYAIEPGHIEQHTDVMTKLATVGFSSRSTAKASDDADVLHIRVRDGASNISKFKVKKTDPLSKAHEHYCKKLGLVSATVKFFFDGDNVVLSETPENLDMEDGDLLDATVSK